MPDQSQTSSPQSLAFDATVCSLFCLCLPNHRHGDEPSSSVACSRPHRLHHRSPSRVQRHQIRLHFTSAPITATATPTTLNTIPECQKMRRPESSVIEVTTSPISRNT